MRFTTPKKSNTENIFHFSFCEASKLSYVEFDLTISTKLDKNDENVKKQKAIKVVFLASFNLLCRQEYC